MIREFFKPASVPEAIELKEKYDDDICFFGGGTSINHPGLGPGCEKIISLESLGLKQIEETKIGLNIGASVTFQELLDVHHVPAVLREAASHMRSRNLRNMATIGGNIASNRPDAYLLPCLIALTAEIETAVSGRMPVEDYIQRDKGDLILEIHLPPIPDVCAVRRIARQDNDPTIVSAAVRVLRSGGEIKEAVIAIGGVADHVVRLSAIERQIQQGTLRDKDAIEKAVSDTVSPKNDILGSAAYKIYISGVVVSDCVEACLKEGV